MVSSAVFAREILDLAFARVGPPFLPGICLRLAVIGAEMPGRRFPAVAAQKLPLLYGGCDPPFEALYYNVR